MNKDFSHILNMYNYFDGAIITDDKGVIVYYSNFRTDIYDLRMDRIIGKSILEIHPDMTEEDSSILQVLKTGKPVYDRIQKLTTPHGHVVNNLYSTLPIIRHGKIVGAVDLSRCIGDGIERKNIVVTQKSEESQGLYTLEDIITTSSKMKEIKMLVPKIASTDSSVLIYGETGTGKELIAQSIHTSGIRADKKFISQNCAAIPVNLLEGILFGTAKGSYTGAEERAGLFEIAHEGTLFLDEVNSMDISMQAKLLKVIEEKQIRRIGSEKTIPVDVKIISAMNEEPDECVRKGKIREDLFYRLNTVEICIPPLRERTADIKYLMDYFIAFYNSKMNKNVIGISSEVEEIFNNYNWPGNVRELENIIEGAFNTLSSSIIEKINLPQYLTRRYEAEMYKLVLMDENMSLDEKVAAYERKLIVHALDSTVNALEAAKKLKLSKQTLNYKLKKYNLREKRTEENR